MKKTNITLSIALAAVFSASTAFAEAEVTGKIVHESAKFTNSGHGIGDFNTDRTEITHGKDNFKQETSARIYIDGEADAMQEGATYHVELNLMKDGKATTNYDSNESYTQRDALREAYVDAEFNDWSIRAGKQQVVWGTADGMKLLDMINPTDYGEMAQNQMEDSRIPVWMLNAETTQEDGSEFQVVVSQPRENVFAGLNRNIDTKVRVNGDSDLTTGPGADQGNAFIMKGVDSITGKKNGFLNIVPDLSSVAGGFYSTFGTGYDSDNSGVVDGDDTQSLATLVGSTITTVNYFATRSTVQVAAEPGDGGFDRFPAITAMNTNGSGVLTAFASAYDTNLNNATDHTTWGVVDDSAFEYMGNTSFATFDAFVGAGSQYVYNMPSDSDVDLALRYKNSTESGVNYSLNASHNYDKNPIINLSWRNSAGGLLSTSSTATSNIVTLALSDTDGGRYGGYADGSSVGAATLRFEQTVERATNLGGAFDMAIETESLGPVVLRGEALYQKDVYTPVMDLAALSVGDLPAALTMVKGNKFKYVLGADITALTNMMVSVQFIQDRDLDYIDETSTYMLSNGTASAVTGSRFKSDYSTMHLTNGFNKAEENKEFYSLFLSKPFGASGEHRWNNIIMFEENGGKWNRLDAEFSIDDDTQATVEYNKYWGDANTQFGQLEKSSNIQVGVKYSF